jgi:hypothetical protein
MAVIGRMVERVRHVSTRQATVNQKQGSGLLPRTRKRNERTLPRGAALGRG